MLLYHLNILLLLMNMYGLHKNRIVHLSYPLVGDSGIDSLFRVVFVDVKIVGAVMLAICLSTT